MRLLARGGSGVLLQPGDVTGRWATWTKCPSWTRCRNFLHDIRNDHETRLPNPRGRSQFAPSVLADGTVIYGESRNINTCGSRLRLFEEPRPGERRRISTLGDGFSISTTSSRRRSSSRIAVYYDRVRCDLTPADIYRVVTSG